ncbi:MAG: T9SS type A sorting domain-containing protein [Syntrophothermus sp.]
MKKICFFALVLVLGVIPFLSAQVSVPGEPLSFREYIPANRSAVIRAESPDVDMLLSEDSLYPSPYRYGTILPAEVDIDKDGQWDHVADGDLWRATVQAPGALAIGLYFDRFWLPPGSQLFVYDPSRTKVIGAFTSQNNHESGLFATEIIPGEQIILEYFQPAGTAGRPLLHISELSYVYRGVGFTTRGFGGSGACEVNVNCSEGWSWSQEAKGVALIGIRKGTANYWCTGSLVNNVRNDKTPYFLTADHCGEGATPQNLLQWVFYFHYEAPDCVDPPAPPIPKSITGAVLKAHGGNSGSTGSDFFLVQFVEDIPVFYDVYFNGWSRLDPAGTSGVTIHHPMGDIKKISFYNTALRPTTYGSNPLQCFWKVRWAGTEHGYGVTEGGSSGSPLFDASHLIVGTLTGGTSSCDTAHLTDYDYYGRFSFHWDTNGPDSSARLKDWLDPDHTNVTSLSGSPLGTGDQILTRYVPVYPNPCTDYTLMTYPGKTCPDATISFFNTLGNQVKVGKINLIHNKVVRMDVSGMPPGIYLLRIKAEDEIFIAKITVI